MHNTSSSNINLYQFHTLQQTSQRLYDLVLKAESIGTYPVAGFLITKDGMVLHEQLNESLGILASGQRFLLNPTNHVQRLIIDWYYQNKAHLSLPQPSDLIILSSLDPCLMCGSSIVASGFHVGIFTLDDYACVNWKCDGFKDFTFSPNYHKRLISHFGYYKVENGAQGRKQYQYDAPQIIFKEQSLSASLQKNMTQAFSRNIIPVRNVVLNSSSEHVNNLKNLEENDPLIVSLKTLYPKALSITLVDKVVADGIESPFYQPNQQLKHLLTELAQKHKANNALALIDSYGNLLIADCDHFQINPIHSAILNVITKYSRFNFQQISNASSKNGAYKQSNAFNYLPSLRNCTFIFLNALPADDPISIQAIGIYGFTVQKFFPKGGFLYINDYKQSQALRLQSIIKFLPKFFSQEIKIQPIQALLIKK